MRRSRPNIPEKRPIFFGCEGESEQAYGAFLNEQFRGAGLPVHLRVVPLNPGSGGPEALLLRAEKELLKPIHTQSRFIARVVLIDDDLVVHDIGRRIRTEDIARRIGVSILWQSPCHEAFLLHHFDGHHQVRPATSALAETALKRVWPGYAKPATAREIAARLDKNGLVRAASAHPDFATFLGKVGFIS